MDNNQAIGYMLLACRQLGLSKTQAKDLYSEMYYLFDLKTEEEAEKQGFIWYHSINICHDCLGVGYRLVKVLNADGKEDITKDFCSKCKGTGKQKKRIIKSMAAYIWAVFLFYHNLYIAMSVQK